MCSHIYYFKINGQREKICRDCFTTILAETYIFVTLAVRNLMATTSRVTYDIKRGLRKPSNKHSTETIEEVVTHIKTFPSYKLHYMRRDNSKRFLPPYLNLQIMFKIYCKYLDTTLFRRKHKTKFGFIQKEVNEHHAEAVNAYLKKDQDKNIAKKIVNTRCYTFDLQQCLPIPFLQSSVAFYKRQLKTFNLTFHNAGSGEVTSEKVILYSDTCGGQNKKSHVAAMLLTVIQKTKNLKVIDHKFMVSGYSHIKCDVDHALIEKQKRCYLRKFVTPMTGISSLEMLEKKKICGKGTVTQ
ncbi:hypothetical protein RN001_007422 [Aquatica leii]|uniref:Uncharacterized protein n=1 Tax=Aquatica leii TaxID=1421715 RepID=A0AAN7PD31_9COLE|nr:hypothetical protein RN001_007422 [Aquatica leii]